MLNLEATNRVLNTRIVQVEESIRLLLKDPSDTSVHRLRVACRQLETVLFLTKDLVCKSDYSYFKSVCKAMIRCSSKVRDMDVMLKESVEIEFKTKSTIERDRQGAVEKLNAKVFEVLRNGDFAKHQLHLEKNWICPTNEQVNLRLLKLYGRALIALPPEGFSKRQLHQWRIAVKKLRYAMDFMIECTNDVWPAVAKRFLVEIQEKTGQHLDELNLVKGLEKYGFKFKPNFGNHSQCNDWETLHRIL